MLISRRIYYFYVECCCGCSLITVDCHVFFGHRVEIVLTITNVTLTVKTLRTKTCEYKFKHCLHTYVCVTHDVCIASLQSRDRLLFDCFAFLLFCTFSLFSVYLRPGSSPPGFLCIPQVNFNL